MIHKIEMPKLFDNRFGIIRHANAHGYVTQEGLENLRDVVLQLFSHLVTQKTYSKIHVVSSKTTRGLQTATEISNLFQTVGLDSQTYIQGSLEDILYDSIISHYLFAGGFTIIVSHDPPISSYFGDKVFGFENCEFYSNFAHLRSRVSRPIGDELDTLKTKLLSKLGDRNLVHEFDRFEKQLARDVGVDMHFEYPSMLKKNNQDFKNDFLDKVKTALDNFER